MTPTVLLTGGFGNIGGRLTDDLITHGDVEIRLASRVAQPSPIWAPNADVVLLDLLEILAESVKDFSLPQLIIIVEAINLSHALILTVHMIIIVIYNILAILIVLALSNFNSEDLILAEPMM